MTNYTIKIFTGGYTLVIMDPLNPLYPGPSFTRLPQKIDLTLYFHKGVIDDDSNVNLLRMIDIIERDLKEFSNLIAAHWFENGEVKYLEKKLNNTTQDGGRIIDSKTYQIASMNQLEEFLNILKSISMKSELYKAPSSYMPLLASKAHGFLRPEEQLEKVKETGIVARGRKLLGCCFG